MKTPCETCPLRRLDRTRPFSHDEFEAVKAFKSNEIDVEPRTEVIRSGERSTQLFTILDGLAYRHQTLPDGRRQILNFLFPADFIGLQAGLYDESPYTITTLTRARLCTFERSGLTRLFSRAPHLAFDLVWMTAEQQSHVDLNLVAVGKFRSEQRIAYLLLSFWTRMLEAGRAEEHGCAFPITQSQIADALGLSQPYANAALGKLRGEGLIRLQGGRLDILDMGGLREMAVIAPLPRGQVPFI